MKKTVLPILVFFLWASLSHAQIGIGNHTTVAFASVDEGKTILMASDDFVERMSPFDRGARMKTDRDVTQARYLAFVGRNALACGGAEKNGLPLPFGVF